MFAVKKSDAEYKEDQIITTQEESSNLQNILPPLKENINNKDLEKQRYRLTIRKEARDLADNPENEEETKYNKILKEYVELMTQADDFELKNKELKNDVKKLKLEINNKQEELKNITSDFAELNIQIENNVKEIESIEKIEKIKTHKIEELEKEIDIYFHLFIGLIVLLFSFVVSNIFKHSNNLLT